MKKVDLDTKQNQIKMTITKQTREGRNLEKEINQENNDKHSIPYDSVAVAKKWANEKFDSVSIFNYFGCGAYCVYDD